MELRVATAADLPRLFEIYEAARAFMVSQGNPHQWAELGWPDERQVREDVASGKLRVCVSEGRVVACLFYDFGTDVEPTYARIDGAWARAGAYGVVHRIASDRTTPGAGTRCLEWALEQCDYLRIDTHQDNVPMRRLLAKLGFSHRGTIWVEDGTPRLAYDRAG